MAWSQSCLSWALYLPVLNPQSANPQQADALAGPNITDIMYFFTGTEPPQGGVIVARNPQPPKVCKLCLYVQPFFNFYLLFMTSSVKYGTNESMLPGISNYVFRPNTASATLRRHLHQVHPTEYDEAVLKNSWSYRLSRSDGAPDSQSIQDGS